jgi:hypothetical protein
MGPQRPALLHFMRSLSSPGVLQKPTLHFYPCGRLEIAFPDVGSCSGRRACTSRDRVRLSCHLRIFNSPISPADARSDPFLGQRIAITNDALVFLHAGAQFAFVVAGGVLAQRRILFLLIAGPISGLAFLISVVGLIAG